MTPFKSLKPLVLPYPLTLKGVFHLTMHAFMLRGLFPSVGQQFFLDSLKLSTTKPLFRLQVPQPEELHAEDPFMAYLYKNISALEGVPESLKYISERAEAHFVENLCANESRIQVIQSLAQGFSEAGQNILFLKGAAEISGFYQVPWYLGQRTMADIDFLCDPKEVKAVDRYLQAKGNRFYYWNNTIQDPAERQTAALAQNAHLEYNPGELNYLECHIDVAPKDYQCVYPAGFAEMMREHRQTVMVGEVAIQVPKPEHQLVHLLCHAAHAYENEQYLFQDRLPCDQLWPETAGKNTPERVYRRFNFYQLNFLLKLHALLEAMDAETLDWQEVNTLLSTVQNRKLLQLYVNLARFYLPEQFKVTAPVVTMRAIQRQRQAYIQSLYAKLWVQALQQWGVNVRGFMLSLFAKYHGSGLRNTKRSSSSE
jgi:hypothetical protein